MFSAIPFVTIAAILLATPASAAHLQTAADQDETTAAFVEASVDRVQTAFDPSNQLSGVLIVRQGDTVLLQRQFAPDVAIGGVPIAADTQIGIASITKLLTLGLVNSLLIEEKFAVDDTVSKWIPDFPDGDRITVGQLSSHRGGVPHRLVSGESEFRHHSPEQLMEAARGMALTIEPGSERNYSTGGFAVLARIIELVEGKPYAQVLQDRIFAKAGMDESSDFSDPDCCLDVARPLLPLNGALVAAPARNLSVLVGGGSAVSTASDLLKFVDALKAGALAPMAFEHFTSDGTVRWQGASNGYYGYVDVLPNDVTIVYVGNSWGGAAPVLRDALWAWLQGEAYDVPAIPQRTEMPPVERLGDYEGFYETRPGTGFHVARMGSFLTFEDNFLMPIGLDRFWQPSWSAGLTFVRDESGMVVAVERDDGTRWERAVP